MTEPLKKLLALIERLIEGRFYGSLMIKFEAGNIVTLKKEETIKLS